MDTKRDGIVRTMALAVTEMHDREELKKLASLSEIQNSYFNFFEQNFGHFYKLMIERKLTPHDAGKAAMQSDDSIREVVEHLDKLMEFIGEFWSELGDIAHAHVEDLELCEAVQLQLEDGVGLDVRQAEAGHEFCRRVPLAFARSDQRDQLIQGIEDGLEAL